MTKVYVGNLDDRTGESDIRKAFGDFGQVESVFVKEHGFAFVHMSQPEEADRVIKELNNG